MIDIRKDSVTFHSVDEERIGQRIDNYLIQRLKGVPKSHIYRILRSGEVRVNKKRVDATYRLAYGDNIRLPPIRYTVPSITPPYSTTTFSPVFEDNLMLVIDKPAGIAVHGGSGLSSGIIEQLRQSHPEYPFLELAHRLDRDTSGLLVLAKKRSALVKLHDMMRHAVLDKRYLALAIGHWPINHKHIKLPLFKFHTVDGERRVRVSDEGQAAHTIFSVKERFHDFTLVEAQLKTGRTHQIRVHMAASACPIAGDTKYGNMLLNRELTKQGLTRMFLHAWQLRFPHPVTGTPLKLEAPLPFELSYFLKNLPR